MMLALLCGSAGASAQSLARPGWAGSGMEAEPWWPHAVLCEVEPDSLATLGDPAEGATLRRLALRLDDLRTLGIDALLLEDLEDLGNLKHDSNQHVENETPAPGAPAEVAAHAATSAVAIDPRYGTLDDFDDLVREAARRGIRILVGVRPGAQGTALTDDARLWLNHGVTGLSLDRDDPDAMRAIRGVLRGYVGARILIAGKSRVANPPSQSPNGPSSTSGERGAFRNTAVARAGQPDLARIALPSLNNGAMPMRLALAHAQAPPSGRGPVPLLSADTTGKQTLPPRELWRPLCSAPGASSCFVSTTSIWRMRRTPQDRAPASPGIGCGAACIAETQTCVRERTSCSITTRRVRSSGCGSRLPEALRSSYSATSPTAQSRSRSWAT